MAEEEQSGGGGGGGGGGTIVLMLGLYLIILAFFILLNVIAEDNPAKYERTAEAVAMGFGFKHDGKIKFEDREEKSLKEVYNLIKKDILKAFESYLTLQDYRVNSNESQLRVALNTDQFFEIGDVRPNPIHVYFFEELAYQIYNQRPGVYITLDVVVNASSADVEGTGLDKKELAARRSAILTRVFLERGVRAEHVSAGMEENEDQKILLYFDVIVADEDKALTLVR